VTRSSALLLLALCACGGGPGTLNGTVGNTHLEVRDAVFTVTTDSAGNPVYAQLILSDFADTCGALKAHRNPSGATSLSLNLFRFADGAAAPLEAGQYQVTSSLPKLTNGSWGSGELVRNDPHCTNMLSAHSAMTKEGRLDVQAYCAAEGGILTGGYELTFGDQGDRASGDFTARFCDWSPGELHCE
jgi:hypothetical protein